MNGSKAASTASSGEKKRKRAPERHFYAVKAGHTPGVYLNWTEAELQTRDFHNAVCQKFSTLSDAEAFMKGTANTTTTAKSKGTRWYGVQVGFTPGVYTSWDEVVKQTKGCPGSKQQRFNTEEEARAFVNAGKGASSADISRHPSTVPSIKEETGLDMPGSLSRKGCKVGDGASKKQKKNDGSAAVATMTNGDFELGTGPLPSDAEDGFDRRIKMDPRTGNIVLRTEAELARQKPQPTGDFSGPLVIYTDGASRGNGKVGARAGFGVYFGPNDDRNISERLKGDRQTNQRAELTAIQRAINIAPIDRDVLIKTDSNYSIKCLTEWFPKWRKNNWLNSAGKTVENKDLIEPTLDRIDERYKAKAKTNFEWVKGHSTDPGNIAADLLATRGADARVEATKLSTEGTEREPLALEKEKKPVQESSIYDMEDGFEATDGEAFLSAWEKMRDG